MARVVVSGVHPVAVELRALIRGDQDLLEGAHAWRARFVVDVAVAPAGSVVMLDLGARISPTEQQVLAMLLRLVPHVLSRCGAGVEGDNHLVVRVPVDASEALCWQIAHGVYRGLLTAAGIAPARPTKTRAWWARLRGQVMGARG